MRIVLHIGMPKTGSTHLQAVLNKNRRHLGSQGILFPENPSPLRSQTFLVAAVALGDQGRTVRALFSSQDELEQYFRSSFEDLKRQVTTTRPETLILSSELLFRVMSGEAIEKIKTVLGHFAADLEVVCYVRNPADYYLSLMLQRTKQSSIIHRPGPVNFRDVIEGYRSAFSKVTVLPYNRSRLIDESVVSDFVSRFLRLDPAELRPSAESNTSVSAEGMELIRLFRESMRRDCNDLPDEASQRYEGHIRAAEQSLEKGHRAKLRREVADYIISASTHVMWLRDKFGIEFDGLDYSIVGTEVARPGPPASMADVCEFDPGRFQALQMKALELALLSNDRKAEGYSSLRALAPADLLGGRLKSTWAFLRRWSHSPRSPR